jgi:hypothetical protein
VSDDLRARIAAVQLHHYPVECAGYVRCGCGANFVPWSGAKAAWGNHLADAVIAELGLQQEESAMRPGWEGTTFTRYVTEWETA